MSIFETLHFWSKGRRAFLPLLVAALAVFWPSQVRADQIVFDTLAPGGTYSSSRGYDVADFGPRFFSLPAAGFTAMASGILTAVDFGLTADSLNTHGVNVFFYQDAGDSPDNATRTLLGTVMPTAIFGTTNDTLLTLNLTEPVRVHVGDDYWLALEPTRRREEFFWNISSLDKFGAVAGRRPDGSWASNPPLLLPAFRITARDAVPDTSSTFCLMAIGISVLLCIHRVHRVSTRQ
jgi:hypothetical protein